MFFSLNLISSSLEPLRHNEALIELLTQPQNPIYAILFGCLFTAAVQSSSVTTGLAIVFTQQGLLGLENAVPLIMGANIGTTATALIAMFNMDIAAKKTALTHFLFNLGGVMIFLPVLFLFDDRLSEVTMPPAIALANIHLVFNIVTSLIFVFLLVPFTRLVDWMLGEGKMDFERLPLPTLEEDSRFETIKAELEQQATGLLSFLQENYNLATLSIETNYHGIYEAAEKRIEYFDFVKKEYLAHFSRVVTQLQDEAQSGELIRLINRYDYLFQVHDSINDLHDTKKVMSAQYIELKSDILLLLCELSSNSLVLFDRIGDAMEDGKTSEVARAADEMQAHLDEANKDLLKLMADPGRRDAGAMTNFVTYSQRLKDKLVNYANLNHR